MDQAGGRWTGREGAEPADFGGAVSLFPLPRDPAWICMGFPLGKRGVWARKGSFLGARCRCGGRWPRRSRSGSPGGGNGAGAPAGCGAGSAVQPCRKFPSSSWPRRRCQSSSIQRCPPRDLEPRYLLPGSCTALCFASLCSIPPVPPRSDPLGARMGTFPVPVPHVLYLHPQTFAPRSLLPPRVHAAAAEAALARIISLLRLKRCCLINCRLRGVVVRRLRSPVSPPRTGCRFADGTRSRPTGAEKGLSVRFTPRWPRPVQTAAERRRRFPGAISDRQLMNLGENTRPDLPRPRELPGGRIPDRRLRHPPESVSGDFRLWWRRIRVQGSPVVPPPWVLGSTRFLCVV